MQTVILAGGTGKRVFPLGVNKPKPMFQILGKPLIQYVIETLKEVGLEEFLVVLGHNGELIKDYLTNKHDLRVNITYTLQKEALGMANALETAKDFLEEDFLVVNADDLFECSLIKNMIKSFEENNSEIILSCKPVEETWKYGIIQKEGDSVIKFIEKPAKGQEPSNLAVIGAYKMTKRIFNYIKKVPVSDQQYEAAIQEFIKNKKDVKAICYEGFFGSYKYPWDLFTLNAYLMNKCIRKPKIEDDVEISEDAIIEGNVWIRKGTRVLEGTCIKGPCYIGSKSLIGNNCLIWNYASIGNNCVVGFSSEIKSSLIGNDCWFHTNYVGDSIISDNCSFGAGTILANFRFDEKSIRIRIAEKEVDSGKDKFGAIIADNCKIGVNASLLPGVKVGPQSIIGPNVCLYNDLEPNKMILVDQKSYVKKENKISTSSKKRSELMEKLMKYK